LGKVKVPGNLGFKNQAFLKTLVPAHFSASCITDILSHFSEDHNSQLRLKNEQDLMSAEKVRAGLRTRYVGQTVYYWPAVGSTNDELKRLADAGAPEGALAIADEQVAGRGRLDRSWVAPAGSSLLMSLLFRPAFLAPVEAQQLTMICSLAAADAVVQVTGLQPALKWPNDLILEGRKLAGVLTELGFATETGASGAALAWAIVGVGLNVNVDFAAPAFRRDWPDLAGTAISLQMAAGRPISRLRLLHSYLLAVEIRYTALRAGQSPHAEWAGRLATLGRPVTVSTPDGLHQGIADGVDEAGALLLRRPDGQVVRILAGDVMLR
jgi:BirA family biotin operon repressor/biotin-[acetyl-CoA-carboxylase] ligase